MITQQTPQFSVRFTLSPENNQRLAVFCGQCNENLKLVEAHYGVKIYLRGHRLLITGLKHVVEKAQDVIVKLYALTEQKTEISPQEVHMQLHDSLTKIDEDVPQTIAIPTREAGLITPKGKRQLSYLQKILSHDVNFGVGPAGTGKTFLAVLCAVQALEQEQVKRIVLVRPAVEAGESLGFLPGDFSQKVEPYLRPLYDAMHDLMGGEWVNKHMELNQIEVVPLAYMRGRTLHDSFIILDEAQNTTQQQMKMFLTRLGFGSTAVITGDQSQIDLPGQKQSGLIHALNVLEGIEGISFSFFQAEDAVRHRLVQQIIKAYEKHA